LLLYKLQETFAILGCRGKPSHQSHIWSILKIYSPIWIFISISDHVSHPNPCITTHQLERSRSDKSLLKAWFFPIIQLVTALLGYLDLQILLLHQTSVLNIQSHWTLLHTSNTTLEFGACYQIPLVQICNLCSSY